MFAKLAGRDQDTGDGPWRSALGEDPAGYVRIARIVSIGGRFRCWSEMHLPFARFGRLLEMPRRDIESVNLKRLLASHFNAPTLATAQTVLLHPFSAATAKAVGVDAGTPGLLLQIVGISRGGVPITFQRIHVPPSDCEMEIGADALPLATAAAA